MFRQCFGSVPVDRNNASKVVMSAEYLAGCLAQLDNDAKAKELKQLTKHIRAEHPEWAKANHPRVERAFIVWEFLPFPIDIAPKRL
jgi:hypothetical protein